MEFNDFMDKYSFGFLIGFLLAIFSTHMFGWVYTIICGIITFIMYVIGNLNLYYFK